MTKSEALRRVNQAQREAAAGAIKHGYPSEEMGPFQQQKFSEAILTAVAEERERCLAAVKDEEELDGIPTEMQFCEMRAAGFVETCRAIVRATKNNIAERIRARDFQPEPPEKADD